MGLGINQQPKHRGLTYEKQQYFKRKQRTATRRGAALSSLGRGKNLL
jgi:hypothetical protein